jgi:hypothetical protein
MLIVFANNLTIIDNNGVGATVYTDPVPINGNSFATGITTIHKMFNPFPAVGLSWAMEVSNDGQEFIAQGPSVAGIVAEATSLQAPTRVSGVFARLKIMFQSAVGNIGAATLDIHVNFDTQ